MGEMQFIWCSLGTWVKSVASVAEVVRAIGHGIGVDMKMKTVWPCAPPDCDYNGQG